MSCYRTYSEKVIYKRYRQIEAGNVLKKILYHDIINVPDLKEAEQCQK